MTKLATAQLYLRILTTVLALSFTQGVGAVDDDYQLGAGDIIRITIFESPSLNTDARISESGAVSLPILGKVNVSGLNTDEAANQIARSLEQGGILKIAHVSVMVSQFMSRQVSVIGQVNKPGKYVLDKSSSLIDVLATAGGIGSNGGNKAILIRKVDGQEQKTEINLSAVLNKQSEKNLQVLNGDIIYVPDAEKFYIYGEVQKPGIIKLEPNMSVLHAISAAGGITNKGSESNVELKRLDPQGNIQILETELGELVKPNDIIFIPEGWF